MKRKVLFLFFALSVFITTVNAASDNFFKITNPSEICTKVKDNTIRFYVYDFYKNKNIEVGKVADSCSNTNYFNDNLANKKKGETYNAWVWHGRSASTNKYYVEGQAKAKKDYQYFAIANAAQSYTSNKLVRTKTLKPGDKTYFTITLGDKAFSSTKYKDVRISLDYGHISGDLPIIPRSSITYYAIDSSGKSYGPYQLSDYYTVEAIRSVSSSDTTTKTIKYRLISENILSKISSSVNITKIKIVPFDNYNIRGGMFRFYNISLTGYSGSYSRSKTKVSLSSAESTIRHRITNNMIAISTIRWNVNNDNNTQLYFYHHYNKDNPQIYKGSSSTTYYGMPYVNSYVSTLESFTTHTVKTTGNNNKVLYRYNLPTKYNTSTTATNGKDITKGDTFPSGKLYVREVNANYDSSDTRGTNLSNNPYISNSQYFYGSDCSASTYVAAATEIPIVFNMAGASRYSTSAEVKVLGSIKIDNKGFEKELRNAGILKNNQQLTDDHYKKFFTQYFKKLNAEQDTFESYALSIPGDMVAKRGHVRMVTGYPYVECKDGTHTRKYTKGFCKDHKGIDYGKSYVITTEISGSYGKQANRTFTHNGNNTKRSTTFAKASATNWSFSLNSKYTDITNIDDYLNINGTFIVNNKYSFRDLYGPKFTKGGTIDPNETRQMYLIYRYKSMSDVASSKKVEVPTVKMVGASTDETLKDSKRLAGNIITNYIIQEVKYEVNGKVFKINPLARTEFSLYYDTTSEIRNYINSQNAKNLKVKVSVKQGPVLSEVQTAGGLASGNYKTILNLDTSKVPDPDPGQDPDPGHNLDPGQDPEQSNPDPETDDQEEYEDDAEPVVEIDEDDEILGENQEQTPSPSNDENNIENPNTGAYISIIFITSLTIILVLISKNAKKYDRIKKI